ncbi:MAG: hypothetical protein RJA76_505 [Bacteroidota bacterium]|jgi:mannose-1-phosphate guanylyltransferase
MKDKYLVIMAGGIGTRFWPISRSHFPKQFHDVLGTGKTMLQETADRFNGMIPSENVYVVTSQEFSGIVKEQLPYLKDYQILCEPQRRNTAPCIAYAAYKISKINPKATLVVVPSDHVILKTETYQQKIKIALEAAKEQVLVTLGILPTRPDTGYGYIQYQPNDSSDVFNVKTFTEKPNIELAEAFLDSGDYVWNAGMFIFSVKTFKKELEKHQSRLAEQFEEGMSIYYSENENEFIRKVYTVCKNISVDVGIMEKSKDVKVVLADIGWSDLGTWKSLYEIQDKDHNGNVVDANALIYNTNNTIVKTSPEKLVVISGLKDFIVVENQNVLMICPKDKEQDVKQFVEDASALGEEFS